MKQVMNKTKFTCDECYKTITVDKDYPYSKGWTYLYNLSFKTSALVENSKQIKDKHFCGKDCMSVFVACAIAFPKKTGGKKDETTNN